MEPPAPVTFYVIVRNDPPDPPFKGVGYPMSVYAEKEKADGIARIWTTTKEKYRVVAVQVVK